ncbi:MAG: DUF4340 domain-containing protein [Flavobacteriales bacterium]|nr:hypothetical protein [Flavobacteriales bacterium]MCC6576882.1 DUF4340 domain-containing protein [Flavobacteriales bacterium]NUQ14080.1 DUF4340 domain-containing protein [Flavobacteriales bacterium]
MWRDRSTRALLIAAAVLALLLLVSHFWSPRSRDRSFRDVVMTLDTAAVTGFSIFPSAPGHRELRFDRSPAGWTVSDEGGSHRADDGRVREFLGGHAHMRAKRLTGFMDLVKERYDLTDSLRETVVFRLVDGAERTVHYGRNTFAPGNVGMWSAVNLPGEREVFAVEGTMSMYAEQPLDEWRTKWLVRGDPAHVRSLRFHYSMDTAFTVERRGGTWMVDADTADQSKVDGYLASLMQARAQAFADTVNIAGLAPDYSLEVGFDDGRAPITVNVFTGWSALVAVSSLDPGSKLRFDTMRELPRMFRTRGHFLP